MRQLLPLALSVNTIVVMWLAGSKRALGWVFGLVGQAGWVAFVVMFEAWGLLPLTAALTVIYVRNLIRWRREDHGSAPPRRRRHGWIASRAGGYIPDAQARPQRPPSSTPPGGAPRPMPPPGPGFKGTYYIPESDTPVDVDPRHFQPRSEP